MGLGIHPEIKHTQKKRNHAATAKKVTSHQELTGSASCSQVKPIRQFFPSSKCGKKCEEFKENLTASSVIIWAGIYVNPSRFLYVCTCNRQIKFRVSETQACDSRVSVSALAGAPPIGASILHDSLSAFAKVDERRNMYSPA